MTRNCLRKAVQQIIGPHRKWLTCAETCRTADLPNRNAAILSQDWSYLSYLCICVLAQRV